MREAVTLLEKMLRKKIGDNGKYTIRVNITNQGNLPNRAPFIRKVYRQSSLLEYMDMGIGDVKPLETIFDIHYTVTQRALQEDKISETYDLIEKDLDDYMFSKR